MPEVLAPVEEVGALVMTLAGTGLQMKRTLGAAPGALQSLITWNDTTGDVTLRTGPEVGAVLTLTAGVVVVGGPLNVVGITTFTTAIRLPGNSAAAVQARNVANNAWLDLLYMGAGDIAVIPRALSVASTTITGTATVTTYVDAALGRFTAAAFPAAGTGVEIGYKAGRGFMQAAARPSGAFSPMDISGDGVRLIPGGNTGLALTVANTGVATGLSFSVTGQALSHSASKAGWAFAGGASQFWSWGADDATTGTFSWIDRSSAGALGNTRMTLDATNGLIVVGDVWTTVPGVTGVNFYNANFRIQVTQASGLMEFKTNGVTGLSVTNGGVGVVVAGTLSVGGATTITTTASGDRVLRLISSSVSNGSIMTLENSSATAAFRNFAIATNYNVNAALEIMVSTAQGGNPVGGTVLARFTTDRLLLSSGIQLGSAVNLVGVPATLSISSTYGFAICAAAGDTYDFVLFNRAGTTGLMSVPAGTLDVLFSGNVSMSRAAQSTLTIQSIASNDAYMRFLGTATVKNWRLGKDISTGNAFDIQASVTNGGVDFASIFVLTSSGNLTLSGSLGAQTIITVNRGSAASLLGYIGIFRLGNPLYYFGQDGSDRGAILSHDAAFANMWWDDVGNFAVRGSFSVSGVLTTNQASLNFMSGPTSVIFWNSANNTVNMTLTDGGGLTVRAGLTVTGGGFVVGGGGANITGGVTLPSYGAGGGAITVGAADSGGAGFKVLRVPN